MSSHPSPEEIFLSERNEGRIWVQGNDENRAQGIDGVLLKQYFNVWEGFNYKGDKLFFYFLFFAIRLKFEEYFSSSSAL